MAEQSYVITGMGVASALGFTPDDVFDAVLAGRCGAVAVEGLSDPGKRQPIAAAVDRRQAYALAEVAPEQVSWPVALALAAARQALADAGVTGALGETAFCVGCSLGLLEGREAALALPPIDTPEGFSRYSPHHVAADAARFLGAQGAVQCLTTTCAASNYAVGVGLDLLRRGEAESVLVGGVDTLSSPAYIGFRQIRAVAETCRPFDAQRAGILFGEGAAFLHLETSARAEERGAPIYGALLGVGYSNDAYHLMSPHPEGSGAAAALRNVLRDADLEPRDVGFIHTHGTGTPLNDIAEARAIDAVFGEAANALPVFSTKGATGHTLAAAGALEAVLTLTALRRGRLPGTVGLAKVAPDIALDVVREPRPHEAEAALSSAFGFGGNNAVLALGNKPRPAPVRRERPVYVTPAAAVVGDRFGIAAVRAYFSATASRQSINPWADHDMHSYLGAKGLRHVDRTSQLLAAVLVHDCGDEIPGDGEGMGIVFGQAYPGAPGVHRVLRALHDHPPEHLNPMHIPFALANCSTSWVALRRGITGFSGSVAGGRCAGLDAVVLAARQIRAGRIDAAFAGGGDTWVEPWRCSKPAAPPFYEGVAMVHVSAEAQPGSLRLLAHRSAFDARQPRKALRRIVDALASSTAGKPPLRYVAGENRENAATALFDEAVIGDCLGATGVLRLIAGHNDLTGAAPDSIKRRLLIGQYSPEGFATAVLFEES